MNEPPIRILMVCLGNICRSPLAEGILKEMADPEKIMVESAGTAGYHVGNPPDPRSVSIASKYGIDISTQRCRKFGPSDFEEFDLILAMDRSNYRNILQLANGEHHYAKVRLLMEELPDGPDEVPDPYYGGQDGFENVFQLVSRACKALLNRLENEKKDV
ncbi:low molecular weight protein-tyrosine-phosphatase [Zeaxanthinibacter enoshimensis]|uniref:protein-tyrosine-phosphatase n=1 Tax=Zeaxanthinibacter enoshimensis TaxID=392009 RepID=A0A4R6TNX3_9FLAO|nr:low molecular weight protein-tyrosine-phosphatase [Zeaxanthinibacter enoshimensis]TDQ31648.1 protein-tyrosine phosphatase [Zeaxanthinibacter enoshimensis]